MLPRIFNVLLVEDDVLDAMQIQKSLDKCQLKYSLVHAENAEAAQKILQTTLTEKKPKPHFILLDMSMPRMNGLEFLKWLRGNDDLSGISVFILSSTKDEREILSAFKLNIAGYLLKPHNYDQFHLSMGKLKEFVEVCEFPR